MGFLWGNERGGLVMVVVLVRLLMETENEGRLMGWDGHDVCVLWTYGTWIGDGDWRSCCRWWFGSARSLSSVLYPALDSGTKMFPFEVCST